MLATLLLACRLICGSAGQAQVFEVGGGNSSLLQTGGGSVTMHEPKFDLTLGAGTADGRLLGGGRMVEATQHGTYLWGDDRIDFRLPTDIFDTSHFVQMRGFGFSAVHHESDIVAFAGATSLAQNSPFFNGAKASQPAALLFVKKRLNAKWQLYSDQILSIKSTKLTQIEALQWTPAPRVEVAIAAGVGANRPFGAASLNLARPRFDLQAAYIQAGENFHRIAGPSPLEAEPDRENLALTVRPLSIFTLNGIHQNYRVPLDSRAATTPSARSSIDEGSATLHVAGAQLTGAVYRSTYEQPALGPVSNHAAAFSAMRDLTQRLHFTANYFVSKPKGVRATGSFLLALSAGMNAHVSVTENLTYSNGRTGSSVGGEFLSNPFSFSASYQTFYTPAQNNQPFEQALLLDVKLRVLGRLLLHGATFVDATGRLRYTTDAKTVVSREQAGPKAVAVPIGRYILRGCVVDTEGAPVEGAAMLIDQLPVYTDSAGCFSIRETKPRAHRLSMVTSEFLVAGNWQVSSMPSTIVSTREDSGAAAIVFITVRRIPVVSAIPSRPCEPCASVSELETAASADGRP